MARIPHAPGAEVYCGVTAVVVGRLRAFVRQKFGVAIGRRELKQRIVRVNCERERMDGPDLGFLVQIFAGNNDRPLALHEPHREILLDQVALMGIDLETTRDDFFRTLMVLVVRQQAGSVSAVTDR